MTEQSNIPVGYVRRAHGIGGDVVVRGLVSDAADRFVPGARLATSESPPRTFEIERSTDHQGDYLVSLGTVASRNDAEALVGVQFVIPVAERRELDDGEWWSEDLVGCRVVGVDGVEVGIVEDVVIGAAQDRLVVQSIDTEPFEVPFVDALVPTVDVQAGVIVVDLPDGLSG